MHGQAMLYRVQQTCMEAACCAVLHRSGMATAPAQMSALGRAHTAGPDALLLWQNEQGPCLQNHIEAASQHSVDVIAVKPTVASLTEDTCREVDWLKQ